MTKITEFRISNRYYTIPLLMEVVKGKYKLSLEQEVVDKIVSGSEYVKKVSNSDQLIYGVNTGFGSLCTTHISSEDLSKLQHNLLLSHACGVGDIVDEEISRITILNKLLSFRHGRSGVKIETVMRLIELWNLGIIPAIPKKGTVGASGDLAPLAHMSQPLIGLGQVWIEGKLEKSSVIEESFGLKPIVLGPKEGLALTNGVQYITAGAISSLAKAQRLVKLADICAAFSMQGFSSARSFYQELVHTTSYHKERQMVSHNLRTLLEDSNHYDLPHCNQAMEDPYSFRCVPQVHAAIRQTISFCSGTIENECNSVSDNPLVFPSEEEVLTCGNLHGQSTAFALDFGAIAISELSNISERRSYQLLSGQNGLPPFLINEQGVNSGFMIVQYTSASLVNENKVLSTPASIDTIPTCHLQEDHVSMGGTSAYKLETILANCEMVLAIEFLLACQAIDINKNLTLPQQTKDILAEFRPIVPFVENDVLMHDLIENAHHFVQNSEKLNQCIGTLQ